MEYTDRARKVFAFAAQEASLLGCEYIGTEHVLLGIVREGYGIGGYVLKSFGLGVEKIRQEAKNLVPSRKETNSCCLGKMPRSPRVETMIERATKEASERSHNYIGTEHLTLAMLQDDESIALQILKNLNITAEEVRRSICELLNSADLPNLAEWRPLLVEIYQVFSGMKKDGVFTIDWQEKERIQDQIKQILG